MNDNTEEETETGLSPWYITALVLLLIAMIPGGIVWSFMIDSPWPLGLTAIGLIFGLAG